MELAKGDYNVLTKPPSKFGKNKKTVYMLKPNSIAITADNVNDEVSTNQMLRSIRWLSPREGLTGMTGVSTRPPGGAWRQLRLRTPQRRQKRQGNCRIVTLSLVRRFSLGGGCSSPIHPSRRRVEATLSALGPRFRSLCSPPFTAVLGPGDGVRIPPWVPLRA
jgi:hypothetical protein